MSAVENLNKLARYLKINTGKIAAAPENNVLNPVKPNASGT